MDQLFKQFMDKWAVADWSQFRSWYSTHATLAGFVLALISSVLVYADKMPWWMLLGALVAREVFGFVGRLAAQPDLVKAAQQ